jgi:ribosomal protein S18 acetylase RimI-like enzyme
VSESVTETAIRSLRADDLDAVVQLDALLTGTPKRAYWEGVIERFLREEGSIGLAAPGPGKLDGYLFGELRAFEFGSGACGWIFAVGVDPATGRSGVGSALLSEARRRFSQLGVDAVRTMVLRNDVPLLAFFRSHGFVGGPFVQLELDISAAPSAAPGSPDRGEA